MTRQTPTLPHGLRATIVLICSICCWYSTGFFATAHGKSDAEAPAWDENVTQGALRIVDKQGQLVECPLKHTDAQAEITGFLARVQVTQTFVNPSEKPIEATYVFPLPQQAAVDRMTMAIGERRIVGKIQRRDKARLIYEQALAQGHTAALLEQERPNIFTQSVGNIPPGAEVRVEISYVDSLRYDMGVYEFQFPMVVGPRYNPGSATSDPPVVDDELQAKVAAPPADTTRVPDASKINPPVLKPGYRNGHDISLTVQIDAGVPLRDVEISNHETKIVQTSPTSAEVRISDGDTIPNKDFLMRYRVVGNAPETALLNHSGRHSNDANRLGEGYFMLMVQPQERDELAELPPREIVFLVDVSGSMRGEKTAKVVDAMQKMINRCRPEDTLQVITFASRSFKLFDRPVPVVEANVRKALDFSSQVKGSGGTHMLEGVKLAIDEPIDRERMRIVVMLTDGFIGNETEIISHIGKKCGDQIRFWAIGIGSSPNMFLIDGVARQGGGLGKQLALKDDTASLTGEIMTRIQRAQLAKVQIDWGNLPVRETYPARIPELWAGRPIIVYGRYGQVDDPGQIAVRGEVEGRPVEWKLAVDLTQPRAEHDVLASIWARQKIEDLMHKTYYQGSPAIEEEVTAIALDYGLMTQYTSFVAVDEKVSVTPGQPPVEMAVPVPLPEGADWEGFFGDGSQPLKEVDAVADLAAAGFALPQAAALRTALPALTEGKPLNRAPRRHSAVMLANEQQRFHLSASNATGGVPTGSALGRGVNVPRRSVTVRRGGESERFSRTRGQSLRRDGYERAFRAPGQAGVPADPKARGRRQKLMDRLGQELQNHLQSDRLAVAQATLTAIRVLQRFVGDGRPAAPPKNDRPAAVDLHARELQVWSKQLPELNRKLAFELRNASLEKALAQLSAEAQINIHLVDGAADDARALLNRDEALRIEFYNATGKTVWQTLDAVLYPRKLEWYVDGPQRVVVTTGRRRSTPSIWVYDVRSLAWPAAPEIPDAKDPQEARRFTQSQLDRFLQVVRTELKVDDPSTVDWLGFGQLMVYGTPDRHANVARLIQQLSRADAAPASPELRQLSELTSKRLESRQPSQTRARRKLRREHVNSLHDQASWALLADAATGRLDSSALTRLQIAWADPVTAELLTGDVNRRLLPTRSHWAVQQAAAWIPDEHELQQLAEATRKQMAVSLAEVDMALTQQPTDDHLILSAVFAGLADPQHRPIRQLSSQTASGESTSAVLVRALAGPEPAESVTRLIDQGTTNILTPEMIFLTALACLNGGDSTWQLFRANATDLLGSQPLPAELIILINRMDRAGGLN